MKVWCAEHDISLKTYYNWERQIVKAATQPYTLPAPTQAGLLMRVCPDTMPSNDTDGIGTGITIRHGESIISLPVGSSAEAIADLVKALNRHA